MRWNGVWNELHPDRGIYRGIGDEICVFLQFFRIFWTPNGQKRLVATTSTRGPIRLRHVDQSDRATSLSPALSPRQCLASLSPPSRPPLARAGAPARARAPSPGAGLSPRNFCILVLHQKKIHVWTLENFNVIFGPFTRRRSLWRRGTCRAGTNGRRGADVVPSSAP
jgi:hypothetical protein